MGGPFWAKFPHLVTKKKGGTTNPREDFFNNDGTKSPYFKEKKVKFATFRPKLLGCRQNIIAGFQNILY